MTLDKFGNHILQHHIRNASFYSYTTLMFSGIFDPVKDRYVLFNYDTNFIFPLKSATVESVYAVPTEIVVFVNNKEVNLVGYTLHEHDVIVFKRKHQEAYNQLLVWLVLKIPIYYEA